MERPALLLGSKVASASAGVCAADYIRSQVLRISDASEWPKVRVVRCGIDLDRLSPRPSRPAGTPFRVVTVGRLAPEKGLTVLLKGLVRLQESGVDGTTGICVPAGRSDLLAEGIAALAADSERGLAFSTAARRRVEGLYDTRKTTPHLLETIQAAARDSLANG